MDTDLFLVLGIAFSCIAFTAFLNTWSEGRTPRLALVMGVSGAILLALALTQHPEGYGISDVPEAVIRVLGRIF